MPYRSIPAIVVTAVGLSVTACAPQTLPARPPNPTGAPSKAPVTLVRYTCESGKSIQASYPSNDTAIVEYQGNTHEMTRIRSADGARYAGDALEWWTQGTGPDAQAGLFRHTSDGATGEIIESCRQTES